jgi:hypothetical protein
MTEKKLSTWDELTQLEVAYKALATQSREAQIRMLEYLADRLAEDDAKAMQSRRDAQRARIAAKGKRS